MARFVMCSLEELLLMKTGGEGGEGADGSFGTTGAQEGRKMISAEKPR